MTKEQIEIQLKTIFQNHAVKVGEVFYISDKLEAGVFSKYDNFILDVINGFPQLHTKKEKDDFDNVV
jgi:hypothetical protein